MPLFRVIFFKTENSLERVARVIVEVDTIVTFKRLLDWHIEVQEMEGYGSCPGR